MSRLDYIGRKPCGCVVAAASGELSPKHLARSLSEMAKAGLSIERMDRNEVKAVFGPCRCEKPKVQMELGL